MNRHFDALLFHHSEEKSPEDDFFYEPDIKHSQHVKQNLRFGIIDINAVPQINGRNQNKGNKI
jgi:hypothetical protein